MTWEEFVQVVDDWCVVTNRTDSTIAGVHFYFDIKGHCENVSGIDLDVSIAWGRYCETLKAEQERCNGSGVCGGALKVEVEK